MLHTLNRYILHICIAAFSGTTLLSCDQKHVNTEALASTNKRYNATQIAAAIAQLHTGDVTLRRGRGPDSYILAHLNLKDQTYSHCGIVVVENGYPFVYHSIGGEDNPDERLRRDSANVFFAAWHNYGIATVRYNLTNYALDSLVKIVHRLYAAKPLFDLDFNLSNDDRLYCSEMVYKVLIKATQDTGFIPKSIGHGRVFVGIDDLYSNSSAHFITKVNFK